MELSAEELAYLRWHEIPLDVLFDAAGLAGSALRSAMEDDGKYFAYNANRCNRGHRLKSRPGHCIQCRPACIAFVKRHYTEGFVYIAGSSACRLLKVGTTQMIGERAGHLNGLSYGGTRDWKIGAFARTTNAGKVEGDAHVALARYAVRDDLRDGRGQRCIELFKCNFADARKALEGALRAPMDHIEAWAEGRFSFE